MNTPIQAKLILDKALKASVAKRAHTLTHQVEHAGYGAILSRLMTGLNLSLMQSANYHFEIQSSYQIDKLFSISTKQDEASFANNRKRIWNFSKDTWDVKYPVLSWKWLTKKAGYKEQVRAEHQFPECPIPIGANLSRHQWCAVLAQLVCGTPTPYLQKILDSTKQALGWDDSALHIGIHVRRGDKNTECPYIPTETYVEFFKNIANKYPEKPIQIFLTSDDPESYEEFSKALPGIPILWDIDEPRFNNCNAHLVNDQPTLALQESVTAAKNICLLGQCDYVIGMASAQFTWIGGLLLSLIHI